MDIKSYKERILCLEKIRDSLEDDISRKLFDMRMEYYIDRDGDAFIDKLDEIIVNGNMFLFFWDEFYHRIKELYGKELPILIFPAGKSGKRTYCSLKKAGYQVAAFCDNKKDGKIFGKDILSVNDAIEKYNNGIFVISICDSEMKIKLYQQLIRCGVCQERIYLETTEQILLAYGWQYFDLEYMKPEKEEVFVDCGSCNGDNSLDFIKWAGKSAKKIVALEPFKDACGIVENTLKNCGCKSEVHQVAAWCEKRKLRFNENAALGSTGVDNNGNFLVQADTIDHILKGEKVTFIKMDIEGSELLALQGAEKTIKKYKPKLAICVYHKPEDIVEIPYYIYKLRPDYKFYLRHYAYPSTAETVLYCL